MSVCFRTYLHWQSVLTWTGVNVCVCGWVRFDREVQCCLMRAFAGKCEVPLFVIVRVSGRV